MTTAVFNQPDTLTHDDFGSRLLHRVGFSRPKVSAVMALRDSEDPHDATISRQLKDAGFTPDQQNSLIRAVCSLRRHYRRVA